MTEKFRLTYCRYCHNSRIDPIAGVQCNLNPQPELVEEECPEFDLKTEDYLETIQRDFEGEQFEKEKKSNLFWYAIGIMITLIGLAITFYNRSELDNDYRWTITSNSIPKNVFSFKSPLLSQTYLFSTFNVNGTEFENKTDLQYEERPDSNSLRGSHYFIRYNPDNPNNSQIPEVKLIPWFVDFEEVPSNGIQKDSLKYFVQAQRIANKSKKGHKNR